MKKIKIINKLLSSLTLLSPLSGIKFNNQYQNAQKVITENNNALNNNFNTVGEPVQMGDILVNLDATGKIIESYASGEGNLIVDSNISKIENNAFAKNKNIKYIDLTKASNLTSIGDNAFLSCSNLIGSIFFPASITNIGAFAFSLTNVETLDFSSAQNLTIINENSFISCFNLKKITKINQNNSKYSLATNLGSEGYAVISGTDGKLKNNSVIIGGLACGKILLPEEITNLTTSFFSTAINKIDFSNANNLTSISSLSFASCKNLSGDLTLPINLISIGSNAFSSDVFKNIVFKSEVPPDFGTDWQPTVTKKVYVPSEEAKEQYLIKQNFNFDSNQVSIGVPKNNEWILWTVIGCSSAVVVLTVVLWIFHKKSK